MNVNALLVDDHPMLRNGLRRAMEQRPHLTIVGEASSGELGLALALELRPDLVVMGVHLLTMNGIEASRQILRALPATKILIFSSEAAKDLVAEALKAGVRGFILKRGSVRELTTAIDDVMAGKLSLSPELGAAIVENRQSEVVGKLEPSKNALLPREKQMLRLISEGRRNKEIATELKLSPNSIDTYRARLMKKIQCRSTADMVRYAIREGIVAP